MKSAIQSGGSRADRASREILKLRARLHEAENTLGALRSGRADSIVATAPGDGAVLMLTGTEHPYRVMVEAMSEGAVSVTPDGAILYCNKRFAEMVKADWNAIIGSSLPACFADADAAAIGDEIRRSLDQASRKRAILLAVDGTRVPVNVAMRGMAGPYVVVVLSDLTEIDGAEIEMRRLGRALLTLSRANELLVRANSEARLLDAMCQILVDIGGYRMVWVGVANHDAEKSITPIAWAGMVGTYIEQLQVTKHLRITWADEPRGRGPTGRAIRLGEPQAAADFETSSDVALWRDTARQNGFESSAALPLRDASGVFAALTLYSGKPQKINREEWQLLQELAGDLSFGIRSLREHKAREESERKLQSVSENLPGALFSFVLDRNHTLSCTYLSEAAGDLWGIETKEIKRDPSLIFGTAVEFEHFVNSLQRSVAELTSLSQAIKVERPNAAPKWLRMISRPRRLGAAEIGCDGIALDVTELIEAEQRRDYLIYHDSLTDLPNRALFADRLGQALAQAKRDASIVAVIAIEPLSLQKLEDTIGIAARDAVVREAGRRLLLEEGANESIAYATGGTFLALISERSAEHRIEARLHAIERLFSVPFRAADRDVPFETAIGIAVGPADSADVDTLLRYAKTALHRSQEMPNRQPQFYDPSMTASAVARANLEGDLRQAISRGEFVVFYQPVVDTNSLEIVSAEALVRWQHPQRGLVPPSEFIPVAEDSGLIVPIGELVLRQACKDAAAWATEGFAEIPVAVNLSTKQLARDDIVTTVLGVVTETRLDPRQLKLEVTESGFLRNIQQAMPRVQKLLEAGIQFSIDDFGVEQSSLARLAHIPFDIIKIDQSFISEMTNDRAIAAVIEAIVTMAHATGKQVLAEGVETRDQVAYLRAQSCDMLQGYLFSRPVPLEDFRKLLRVRLLQPNVDECL